MAAAGPPTMLRTALAAALAALSLQATAGLVTGTDVTIRVDGFSNGHAAVDVTLDSFGTVGAGQFRGSYDGTSFLTYCTDLFQTFQWGKTSTYTLVANDSDHGFSSTQADRLGKLYTTAGGDATNTTDSVAFQLAVWELLYDTTPGSVLSGNFRLLSGASTAQRNRADAWLAAVLAPSATRSFDAQRLYSGVAQDFVVFTPRPEPPQRTSRVPEPAGLGLVLMALGLLALGRGRA
jgi:hypothetical protein